MPAPKDIYRDFEERFGIRFIEGYGLTETGMVTYHPPGAPAAARQLRRGHARLRGDAWWSPAPTCRCPPLTPRARSWWT